MNINIQSKITILFSIFIIILIILFNINWPGKISKSDEKNILPRIKITINNCNIQKKGCMIETDEFEIKVLLDQNIYYLRPFIIKADGKTKNNAYLENIIVNFEMNGMNMGVNRFSLKNKALLNDKQHWQGKALLPVCVIGRADWIIELELVTKRAQYILSVPMTVQQAVN